ncbi:MAG: JAB domain-containing protein [Nitrospiraceae bacterium]|nr:MAG: JAB domain-containing protein [Nitrospiraceae bacterium]
MEYKSIKDWPEDERPRERLLRFGAGSLSTAQLLAIILRTGGKDRSALDIARDILLKFGSLKEAEDASVAEFAKLKDIGVAKVAQIKASFELGRRLLQEEASGILQDRSFKNSREVYEYYRPKFYGLRKERFLCALLDTKNRVFKEISVSDGTLSSSPVHPREVFKYAIKESAASVLFVHNHPSGDPSPSTDDIDITKRLVETGKIIGIHVLDHVVVTDGNYVSIMEKGYL